MYKALKNLPPGVWEGQFLHCCRRVPAAGHDMALTGKLLELYPPQIVNGIRIYGRNSYLPVFILLTLLGCVTAVNSLFLKETYGKNIEVK